MLDLFDLNPMTGEVSHSYEEVKELEESKVQCSGTRNFKMRLTNSEPQFPIQHDTMVTYLGFLLDLLDHI